MRALLTSACLAILALPGAVLAQSTPVAGLELGISEAEARPLIDGACNRVERVEVTGTHLPEALASEVHLRCNGLTLDNGALPGDAIFTFADDALLMIETRGDASAMAPDAEPVTVIAGFEVFMPAQILLNREAGSAWVLSSPNLAALALSWDNPSWTSDHVSAPTEDYVVPPEIVFGGELADIQASVESRCDLMQVNDIEEIWLDTAPTVQQQLNCYGYEIAGYPRKLEFVFGDGQLEQMWILFGVGDVPRLREFLTATYGPAIHVDETYEVFGDWRIALRKDKFEILMGSDRLAAIWARDGLN